MKIFVHRGQQHGQDIISHVPFKNKLIKTLAAVILLISNSMAVINDYSPCPLPEIPRTSQRR